MVPRKLYESFRRALAYSRTLAVKYGDEIVSGSSRLWDCSSFVARVITMLSNQPTLFAKESLMQVTTAVLSALSSGIPSSLTTLPLLFLYDTQSTANDRKIVHVAIGMPSYDLLTLPFSENCAGKDDLLVVDMMDRGDKMAGLHAVTDWFAQGFDFGQLLVIPFADAAPTLPSGKRWAVSLAFLDLENVIRRPLFHG